VVLGAEVKVSIVEQALLLCGVVLVVGYPSHLVASREGDRGAKAGTSRAQGTRTLQHHESPVRGCAPVSGPSGGVVQAAKKIPPVDKGTAGTYWFSTLNLQQLQELYGPDG
jgi:hypothetical protein